MTLDVDAIANPVFVKQDIEDPYGARHPMLDLEFPPIPRDIVNARIAQDTANQAIWLKYISDRQRRRREAEVDPLYRGFELPHWGDVRQLIASKSETAIAGANGSAKTELAGKLIGAILACKHGMKVLAIAQNEIQSKAFQQAAVWKYLPQKARDHNSRPVRRRNPVMKVNYSIAGGFTDMTLVLANRSQCWFRTVEQYLRSPTSFEGPEYNAIIIDEGCPMDLLETLRYRAGKLGGKIIYILTSVAGMDPVLSQFFDGAVVERTLPMQWDWQLNFDPVTKTSDGGLNPKILFPELKMDEVQVKGCPPGHMPYVLQPLNRDFGVIFTWTHWNPFLPKSKFNRDIPALFDKCIGKPKWQVRVRLFGWIEKMAGSALQNFNPAVHVIPHEKIKLLLDQKKLTTYMACDPGTKKSFFCVWKGIDAQGTEYIFDESPRFKDDGEWVDLNGKKGEGQLMYAGKGTEWYKQHIIEREREHGITPVLRLADPRAFATATQQATGIRTLFEMFLQDGGTPDTYPMGFLPAEIRRTVQLDVEMINTMLGYDTLKAEKEGGLSAQNMPKLFVSDRCQNVIKAWLNWTGEDKEHDLWSDPMDATRYLFCLPGYFINPDEPDAKGGRGWAR
jgi:hypothetical protein